jgi:hypothetical protein
MCVICAKKSGIAIPSLATFEECFDSNKDGAGFAFARDGKVYVNKGLMTFDAFKTALELATRDMDTTETPMLFHFRIGTHGSKNAPEHTHPFPLSGDYKAMQSLTFETDTAIAHNGIATFGSLIGWQGYVRSGVISDASDSMELIAKVFYPLSVLNAQYLQNPDIVALIKEILKSNKIAMLHADGSFDIFGDFITDEGLLYSNSSYRPIVVDVKKESPLLNYVLNYGKGYNGKAYDNYRDYDDDDYDDINWKPGSPSALLNKKTYSISNYLELYEGEVQARESAISAKWRGKASGYDRVIAQGFCTFYSPFNVNMLATGKRKAYKLPILAPTAPWYTHDDMLYFLSMETGQLICIGDIESWERMSDTYIAHDIIGYKSTDFRLWNKKEVKFRQGINA